MGKTAVFVISVLEQLKDNTTEGVVCLCIAHTRELAHQIHLEFERFKRHMENINVGVFYGGVPIAKDRETLKNPPQIVIGTPGRILKLVKDGDLNLKNLKHFVLDECDRCLASLGMYYFLYIFIYFLFIFFLYFLLKKRYEKRCSIYFPKNTSL